MKRAHQQHSAAPHGASKSNSWERAVLPRGVQEEGEKI